MKPHMCPACGVRLTSGERCKECVKAKARARQYRAIQELVEAVRGYQAEHHRPPTIRELGRILGLSSSSTVQVRVEMAVEWGFLEQTKGEHRSLRVPTEHPTSAEIAQWAAVGP